MTLHIGKVGNPMRQRAGQGAGLAAMMVGSATLHARRSGSDALQREEFRMASRSRKRHLSPKARYALELLTVDQRGLTETLLLTYGIKRAMLANLVRAGLATAQRQRVRAGGKTIEVVRMRITEAGRRAAEG
jgi:hypothetical protein